VQVLDNLSNASKNCDRFHSAVINVRRFKHMAQVEMATGQLQFSACLPSNAAVDTHIILG
jgi:hypothetical protein